MKIAEEHVFTVCDVDCFDITIAMVYRGATLRQFIDVKMSMSFAVRSTQYANKVVRNYLERV